MRIFLSPAILSKWDKNREPPAASNCVYLNRASEISLSKCESRSRLFRSFMRTRCLRTPFRYLTLFLSPFYGVAFDTRVASAAPRAKYMEDGRKTSRFGIRRCFLLSEVFVAPSTTVAPIKTDYGFYRC